MYLPISVGLLALGIASLVFRFVTEACVRIVRKRRPVLRALPPVSVLKPMKGADDALYDNLASFARQDYPSFELVLGCEDSMDPALGIARRIQRDYPEVPVTIVAGGRAIGHNPKINNLAQLLGAARNDWVLVSDADIRADSDYLRAIASETHDPSVGLVSSVIASTEEKSLGASLDTLHMNGFIASSVCAAEVLAGHPCVIGKSMLFRTSELARLGGLPLVKDVLAEDYVLGKAFQGAGRRVALSGHAVQSIAGSRSVRSFFERHLRWSQMRRRISTGFYLGEPLLVPTLWFVAAAVMACVAHSDERSPVIALLALVALAVRAASEVFFVRRLRDDRFDAAVVPLVLLKDAVVLGAWVVGWFKTTASWRGTEFRIGRGSVLGPLTRDAAETEVVVRHGAH
jgi:ceramide glucosyltransferase